MKKILSTLAALTLAVSAFTASAAPVSGQLTLIGTEYAGAPVGTMTIDPPGLLNFNARSTTFGVGALKASFNDGSNVASPELILYCIELFAPTGNFGQAVNYSQETDAGLQPFSFTQADRLNKLFAKDFDLNGGVNAGALQSAAMQLAVWEILYDDNANFGDLSAGAFGLGAGEFYSTSTGGARAIAENMLFGLDTYASTTSFSFATFNNGGSKLGKQDFLTASINAGDSCGIGNVTPECGGEVPEPGTFGLMAAAFGALLVTRRRKTAKTSA